VETRKYQVYKLTNSITNKVYIGMTGIGLTRRWTYHKSNAKHVKKSRKLLNAIRKYGTDCWSIEELVGGLTLERAVEVEKEMIQQHNSLLEGYNSSLGGEAYGYTPKPRWTEEKKKKMSDLHKGKSYHPGMPGKENPRYGKPGTMLGKTHSTSARNKMSDHQHKRTPVVVEGTHYRSKTEACKDLHWGLTRLNKYLQDS
jgi:group I intron endonuclease